MILCLVVFPWKHEVSSLSEPFESDFCHSWQLALLFLTLEKARSQVLLLLVPQDSYGKGVCVR